MRAVMLRSITVNSNDVVNNHSKNAYKTVKPPSYHPRKLTTAHFHALLTELILESSLSDQNEVDATIDKLDSDSTLLSNSMHVNSVSIGEIRRLISIPDKGKATSNKT